jgi:hypothetical protein
MGHVIADKRPEVKAAFNLLWTHGAWQLCRLLVANGAETMYIINRNKLVKRLDNSEHLVKQIPVAAPSKAWAFG